MKFVNINLLAKSMEGNNACYFWLIWLKETHISYKKLWKHDTFNTKTTQVLDAFLLAGVRLE